MHITTIFKSLLLAIPLSVAVPAPRSDILLPRLTGSGQWAGAVYSDNDNTFSSVEGTFVLPKPSGPVGTATILVGLDGGTCGSSVFMAGVDVTFNVTPIYTAIYGWHPNTHTIPGFPLHPGDHIKITVKANKSGKNGDVTFTNLNADSFFREETIVGTTPLCRSNAAWVVQKSQLSDGSHPSLPNFGTVTFTSTKAYFVNGVDINASRAEPWQIIKADEAVSAAPSIRADGSVTVKYVSP